MAERVFDFVDVITLAANSTGTLEYKVSQGEEYFADRFWIVSTGVFSIEDIRDNAGRRFSNVSAAEPILSTMLNKPQITGEGVGIFYVPLHIEPGGIFYIDLKDTSGAVNTVTCVLEGKKVT